MTLAVIIGTAVLVTMVFVVYCCISVASHYDKDFFGE